MDIVLIILIAIIAGLLLKYRSSEPDWDQLLVNWAQTIQAQDLLYLALNAQRDKGKTRGVKQAVFTVKRRDRSYSLTVCADGRVIDNDDLVDNLTTG